MSLTKSYKEKSQHPKPKLIPIYFTEQLKLKSCMYKKYFKTHEIVMNLTNNVPDLYIKNYKTLMR